MLGLMGYANPSHNRRKTDDWFRILVEAMHEGMGILDRDRLFSYVNPAFCKMTGYSSEELLGRSVFETGLFDETNQALVSHHLDEHERGNFDPFELEFVRKDGSRFIGHFSPRPLMEQNGQLLGFFAIIADVTERKRYEEQILKLSAAVEQSPIGVLITDREGNIEYANSRFQNLTGYAIDDLIGKNPRVIQSGQTSQETYEALWDSIMEGREWQGELQDKKKNGELYWAKNTIFSTKDASGAINHFVSLHEDITARKHAEQLLRESEEKYSLLVENSLTGIYIVQDGRIVYANRVYAKKLGYSGDELIGMDVSALIHPEDRMQCADLAAATLRGENGMDGFVLRAVTRGGDIVYFKKSCSPIVYRGQLAILGNAVDITKEKELEQELSSSAGQLQALSEQLLVVLEKERQRVAADLHDGVGQYLHALKFGLQKAPQLHCYLTEEKEGGAPGCAELVSLAQEAIDEVRRISADLRPPILDDLGILATINWFCRRFKSVYSEIEIDKQLEIEESDIPETLKIAVFRVLQEAMNNAAKYSGASRLQVRLLKVGPTVALLVADNGVGFELGDVLDREKHEGGLGLISMRERVKLSGGNLTIDSSPDRGTQILASWPLSRG